MRRITVALVGTVAVLVLLFSYRTSLAGSKLGPAGGSGGSGGGTKPGVVRSVAPSTSASPGSTASPGTGSGTETVNGSVVFNGFGPVQVQVKISGGKITSVDAVQTPQDGHSQRINSYAVPQLNQEVLSAQRSTVDAVSGATATSDAYRQSLQAALDAAHFGS
jgi:uncharacterized protein with FMN-binding domain